MHSELYETVKTSDERLARRTNPVFVPLTDKDRGQCWLDDMIYVDDDPEARFQTFLGIGGAMTDATAWTLMQMDEAMRARVLKELFAPCPKGGISILRVPMNSCDFSRRIYSCCDTPNDYELKTFNIDYDRECMIPMLKAALALNPSIRILVSPWSPPAWMKDNGSMIHGGHLRPECRKVWAEFFCRFIQAYAKEGIDVWAVTINNERYAAQPWDSLRMSDEEERDFVRDDLGPALERNGLGHVKIFLWDHNRDHMYHAAKATYADPAASKYVAGCAYHWYGQNCYDNVSLLHDAYPDKLLLFSEGCNGGNNYGDPEWGDADQPDPNGIHIHEGVWEGGERYARNMINDFNRHCNGWIDWNLVLDEKGGPRHLPNGTGAPYIFDTKKKELRPQICNAFISHFSHFIQPGARRIVASPTRNALETTAFLNPDGSIIVILLNETEKPFELYYYIRGCKAPVMAPPRSIQTLVVQ